VLLGKKLFSENHCDIQYRTDPSSKRK